MNDNLDRNNTVTGTNAGLCTDGDFLCTGRKTT